MWLYSNTYEEWCHYRNIGIVHKVCVLREFPKCIFGTMNNPNGVHRSVRMCVFACVRKYVRCSVCVCVGVCVCIDSNPRWASYRTERTWLIESTWASLTTGNRYSEKSWLYPRTRASRPWPPRASRPPGTGPEPVTSDWTLSHQTYKYYREHRT